MVKGSATSAEVRLACDDQVNRALRRSALIGIPSSIAARADHRGFGPAAQPDRLRVVRVVRRHRDLHRKRVVPRAAQARRGAASLLVRAVQHRADRSGVGVDGGDRAARCRATPTCAPSTCCSWSARRRPTSWVRRRAGSTTSACQIPMLGVVAVAFFLTGDRPTRVARLRGTDLLRRDDLAAPRGSHAGDQRAPAEGAQRPKRPSACARPTAACSNRRRVTT